MTKQAGVIGHPLSHSVSPAMFGAAFNAAGIDATYEAWPTTAEELEGRLNALRGDDMLGANVTIPHKEAVIPMLDRLDERAEAVGAVNVIANDKGDLVGYNTDAGGFDRSLREDAGFDPKGKRTAIIGAGGVARAVAYALVQGGASIIQLAGRSPRRLEAVAATFRQKTPPGVTISWCHWMDGVFMTVLPNAHLLVNCTPVGLSGSDTDGQSPMPEEFLPANGLVFDVLYNPAETPLMKAATAKGAKAVGGLGMLVYQAAEAFQLWTGQDAPIDAMRKAAEEAVGG
jgi:shikimate dehydrogenase